MKTSILAMAIGLAGYTIANPLQVRAVTPDNTCGLTGAGNNKGYTCSSAVAGGGRCCSANGWCGNTDAYCGTGCQAAYGGCGAAPASTTKKTTTTSAKSSTTKSTTKSTTRKSTTTSAKPTTTQTSTTPVGTSTLNCGPQYGNQVCAKGLCCSQYGWCNNTSDHCGAGCQSQFGGCGPQSSTTPTRTTATLSSFIGSPTGSTLNCGPAYGNQVCLSGLCCSVNGWCNKDPDHCGAGCQAKFGACGIQTAQPAGPTGSTTICGPANNYAVCAPGLCCGINGQCGTGNDYCSDPFQCQFGYGDCDSSKTPAGASTANDPRPVLGSVSYSEDISACTAQNVVALTYDDGPLDYTDHLLDLLKQYGFHATFFISGNNIAKGAIDTTAPWPSVIKRIIAEGHQVASHTWSHYDLGGLNTSARITQMTKNERAIANIIGKYPTYMRPPFSSCTGACQTDMQALGYHRVYFDLDSQDYLNDAANMIQNSKNIVKWNLGNETQGQSVLVLQHDIHYQTVYNLSSYYFDAIKAKGWKGVSVGECLQDPQVNWYRVPGTGKGIA